MTTIPATGSTPTQDWNFTTASHSGSWGGGFGVEYASYGRWTLTAEALMSRLKYTKVTGVASGSDDPTTGHDERSRTFINEDTRALLWDFPVLVHYRGLLPGGPLSKVYLAAGGVVRTATSIRSSTNTTFPDGTTQANTLIVQPRKRNLIGAVAGIGIRIVDDFKINWTPEIRYTRWAGSTYALESTISPKNQIELSLGFTF